MKKTIAFVLVLVMTAVSSIGIFAEGLENFTQRDEYTDSVFNDVKADDWFYENVASVYEYGLMNGKGAGRFDPQGNITVAETLTIAARLHAIYTKNSTEEFTKSSPWYQVYADYCEAAGITAALTEGLPDDLNEQASRGLFAAILANSFPESEFAEKNNVPDNAIPDVDIGDEYAADIYRLYRSGITIGSDKQGNFYPERSIRRSEVAAIITRIVDPSLRQDLDLGERYIYKHVVIIGVDGGGAFFQEAVTPNLDRIFADGAVTYEAQTMHPSISAQCWGSLLHGVLPEFHGLTNSASTPYPMDSEFPSFFRLVRESDPDCDLASFNNWNVINEGIIENEINVYKDHADSDEAVTQLIINYLRGHDPKVLFVQYDSCDHTGHGSGYGNQPHLDQIERVDAMIGQVYDEMAENGMIEDTLFIVTADHGGTGKGQEGGGSHGGDSPEEMTIMIAVAGKTVQKGTIADAEIRDISAIVLYALGLEDMTPETWTSRVPTGIFEGVEAGERKEYVFPENIRYTHEGEETPALDSGRSIFDIVGRENIEMYLPLDGDTTDVIDDYFVKEKGKLYFVDGYYGQGADVTDGGILTYFRPENRSFSVSCWVKTMAASGDPCIFANKDWRSGTNYGFVLAFRGSDIKFNVGDGKNRMDHEFSVPKDYRNGWMHVIMIVDREAGTVGLCLDFGEIVTVPITDEFKEASFNGTGLGIAFGQDSTFSYDKFPATLDELVIYGKALTAEDVANLKTYYQAERTE